MILILWFIIYRMLNTVLAVFPRAKINDQAGTLQITPFVCSNIYYNNVRIMIMQILLTLIHSYMTTLFITLFFSQNEMPHMMPNMRTQYSIITNHFKSATDQPVALGNKGKWFRLAGKEKEKTQSQKVKKNSRLNLKRG